MVAFTSSRALQRSGSEVHSQTSPVCTSTNHFVTEHYIITLSHAHKKESDRPIDILASTLPQTSANFFYYPELILYSRNVKLEFEVLLFGPQDHSKCALQLAHILCTINHLSPVHVISPKSRYSDPSIIRPFPLNKSNYYPRLQNYDTETEALSTFKHEPLQKINVIIISKPHIIDSNNIPICFRKFQSLDTRQCPSNYLTVSVDHQIRYLIRDVREIVGTIDRSDDQRGFRETWSP